MGLSDDALQALADFDGDALQLLAVANRILASLTRVALAANPVHRHSQGGVRLCRDGAQGHGPGGKALDDLTCGLNTVDGDGLAGIDLELKQTAKRHVALVLVVDELRVFFVGVEVVRARAVLQLGNRIRGPHVVLTPCTPCVLTACVQHAGQDGVARIGSAVGLDGLLSDLKHTNALDP